jgi:DNA polymerase I-like protein with 3'-5' exonuclease and polymerase domains
VTPEQASVLELVRAALPPVWTLPAANNDEWDIVSFTKFPNQTVCIDLEWDEQTGALETIGIGNPRFCLQIDWRRYPEGDYAREIVQQALLELIARVPVVMQNADGDIRKLRANGFKVEASSFRQLDDTMLAHAVLHSEEDHDLGYLSAEYGKLPPAYKDLRKVAPVEYNAADLVTTCVVWEGIEREFASDRQAEAIYRTQSLPFLWLAIEQEEIGIRVVSGVPEVLYAVNDLKRTQARLLARAHCGWPVNIASPDQVKHVLYTLERFPVQREKAAWGEEGKATSNKDAISALRRHVGTEWEPDEEPTLESAWANIEAGGNAFLEARHLFTGAQQAISHYIEPCLETHVLTGEKRAVARIYPECRIHVQASGRVGYVGPALPQLKGKLLDQIGPDPGYVWRGHDWKQIEPRILAYEANDPVSIEIDRSGTDFYTPNIRAIFPEVGSPELEALRRRWGKAFILRIHYRGKPENAGDIPGTRALFGNDTQRLVDASEAYLALHPAYPVFWAKVDAEADSTGLVRTFMGRPRRLTSPWPGARRREASNHKMQGGVADIWITTALLVKQAMPWARLVFGAYDSMWWQIPEDRQIEFLGLYAPIVERPLMVNGHSVSFPADYKFKEAA